MSSGERMQKKEQKQSCTPRILIASPPSFFMLSLASVNSYYQLFLAQGVGLGLGAGLIYMPSMAIQAHYWRRRRALVMGIVITGTAFFLSLYPSPPQLTFKNRNILWRYRLPHHAQSAHSRLCRIRMGSTCPGFLGIGPPRCSKLFDEPARSMECAARYS